MEQTEPTQSARCDLHIRHLEGHANNESEVGEIKIVRRVPTGKIQAAGMSILPPLIAVAIKHVRVMQPKDSMNEHP